MKISIRQKDGNYEEKMFDFVPLSKRHEYLKKERDLSERKDENGLFIEPTADEYDKMQIDFVASLFGDKTVTGKTLTEGLDTYDMEIIRNIIRYRVLGFNKEEDDARKKAIQDNLSAGQNFTI